MNTQSCKRAAAAADFIAGIKNAPKAANVAEIRTELESLPIMIQTNGLLQTLIYLQEKGKHDRNAIGRDLVVRLQDELKLPVATAIQLCSASSLAVATEEALAYAQWLKLLAKAEIVKPNTTPDQEAKTHAASK